MTHHSSYLLRANIAIQLHQGPTEDGHRGKGTKEGITSHDEEEKWRDAIDNSKEAHQLQGIFKGVTHLRKISKEASQLCDTDLYVAAYRLR